jgi:hypothetical protein
MVVPFALRGGASPHAHGAHVMSAVPDALSGSVEVTILHSVTYLAVTGLAAAAVYRRFGVRILRTHWINLDFIWSCALIVTAITIAL